MPLRGNETACEAEAAAKRQKIGPAGSFSSQPAQSSFAEVLERLKEEGTKGTVLQQIGVEDAYDGGPPLFILDLLQNKVDMSQLVITKAKSDYAKQAHIQLAEWMRKQMQSFFTATALLVLICTKVLLLHWATVSPTSSSRA
ncbi:hypothetical protein DFH07DRAFT_1037553 [Mycena maculata]|uniref:DNA-directed DNA polymerase n=1 Tax=Mycena maculata TaxID=230809 RepID=A0AAD7IQS7_9AGAR|nr:hypothetical protein DFH07DRAFT_1037553 [Mycena maculata]